MRFHLTHACLGIFAALTLSAPAAHAFTMEGPSVQDQFGAPKFDIEEQAKNFSNGGAGATNGQGKYETPLGNGAVQFGVQQGPVFGPGGAGFGAFNSRASRADFDRMVTPEGLR